MMKSCIVLGLSLFLIGCNGGSDHDPSTYDTCRITQSSALFASDRTKDVSQCWNIDPTSDGQEALSQCKKLASNYISSHYTFGHEIEYGVSSSRCP